MYGAQNNALFGVLTKLETKRADPLVSAAQRLLHRSYGLRRNLFPLA